MPPLRGLERLLLGVHMALAEVIQMMTLSDSETVLS